MLDIDMEFKQGILMVRLKGILNGDTVGLLKSDLEMVIKDNGIKYVLLNLKKLDYIDNKNVSFNKISYLFTIHFDSFLEKLKGHVSIAL